MEQRGFRFGDWQVEVGGNSLSNGDARTTLEPRVMDVLRYLCRHPGAVIPAEELLQACWGTSELGDNPVHKAIAQLRRALGDSSTEPRYIETVRKRGYRAIAEVIEEEEQAGVWQDGSPFRGLEAFEESHAAIFFGRVQATARLRETVLKQVANGCAMVLALGPSGSGKTSLVRAGLLPQLMEGDGPVALSCLLYLDCADLGDGDLFGALAAVLIDAELDGTHLFDGSSAEALARRLRSEPAAVAAQLAGSGERIRISVFVDRLEAIFRAPDTTDADRVAFIQVLDLLATHRVLVMLACRNDFYPELIALPEMLALKARGGHFDLEPPDGADIAQMVRLPARAAGLTFEHDPATGANLDDVLCDEARARPDALPLLQYCLSELYRLRSEEGILRFEVLQQLGGIEGALGVRAEEIVAALPLEQQAALPHLLSTLVNIGDEQASVTARRVPWSDLSTAAEAKLVTTLVDARLLISELTGSVPTFGVAHEALLRQWPRVVEWIERHRQSLQIRTRVAIQADRWVAANRAKDLLLPKGIQVNQAQALMTLPGFALTALEREFIQGSAARVRFSERLRMAVIAAITLLALLATALGITARQAQGEAEIRRQDADSLMTFMLGDFVDKLKPLGRLDLLSDISDRALSYLASDNMGDSGSAVLKQRAKSLQVIAEVNISRANAASAMEALVASGRILQNLLAVAPKDKELLKLMGANSFWKGQIYFDRSDWKNAELYMNEYRLYSERLLSAAPKDIDSLLELSYSNNSLGSAALRQGKIELAALAFAKAADLKRMVITTQPSNLNRKVDLANSISWLASTENQRGNLKPALAQFKQEEQLLQEAHDTTPTNAFWTLRLAYSLWHQADIHLALGETTLASFFYNKSELLLTQIVKNDESNRSWQKSLYSAQLMRLELDNLSKKLPSIADLQKIEEKIASLAAMEPERRDFKKLHAKAQQVIAEAYSRINEHQRAYDLIASAVNSLRKLQNEADDDLTIRSLFAQALLSQAQISKTTVGHTNSTAGDSCKEAQVLLRPLVATSADYSILAPFVQASVCVGDESSAAIQRSRLTSMGYKDPRYTKYISPSSSL